MPQITSLISEIFLKVSKNFPLCTQIVVWIEKVYINKYCNFKQENFLKKIKRGFKTLTIFKINFIRTESN